MSAKVSVIIPVYNAGRYIETCIESVLSQTYNHIEIIVINDGSNDDSESLICKIAQRDNRVLYFAQENHGVSYARNRGIELATGDYVVFVDADDLAMPNYIETLAKGMEKNKAQMVVCGYYQIDEQGQVQTSHCMTSDTITGTETIERMLKFRDITSALWNKMFSLKRIQSSRIRFRSDISIGEDMVFLTEYCMDLDLVNIVTDALYCYRENPNGAMLSDNRLSFNKKWIEEWNAICEVRKLLNKARKQLHMADVKAIRIADKLLTKINNSDYENKQLQEELQMLLRKHLPIIITEKDFTLNKKISCLLNAISPKLRSVFVTR